MCGGRDPQYQSKSKIMVNCISRSPIKLLQLLEEFWVEYCIGPRTVHGKFYKIEHQLHPDCNLLSSCIHLQNPAWSLSEGSDSVHFQETEGCPLFSGVHIVTHEWPTEVSQTRGCYRKWYHSLFTPPGQRYETANFERFQWLMLLHLNHRHSLRLPVGALQYI